MDKNNTFTVRAKRVADRIRVARLMNKYKDQVSAKDPLLLEFGDRKYVTVFKYGALVFWNMSEGEQSKFVRSIRNFLVDPLPEEFEEDANVKVSGKSVQVDSNMIQLNLFGMPQLQLVSVILARSVILDFFEQRADALLAKFSTILAHFTQTGRAGMRASTLLRLVGEAMLIKNNAVSQMALLDKPDFTWEDSDLDELYSELDDEYEISDRYEILTKKIEALFKDGEFVMGYIEGRQNLFLEYMIVMLFVLDIVLYFI